MLKADVALCLGGEFTCGIFLLRQVKQLEYAASGGLGMLKITESAGDLLQRRGELLCIQQNGYNDADRDGLGVNDQPAAQKADCNIGKRI